MITRTQFYIIVGLGILCLAVWIMVALQEVQGEKSRKKLIKAVDFANKFEVTRPPVIEIRSLVIKKQFRWPWEKPCNCGDKEHHHE